MWCVCLTSHSFILTPDIVVVIITTFRFFLCCRDKMNWKLCTRHTNTHATLIIFRFRYDSFVLRLTVKRSYIDGQIEIEYILPLISIILIIHISQYTLC